MKTSIDRLANVCRTTTTESCRWDFGGSPTSPGPFFPWSIFVVFAWLRCPPARSWGREMSRPAQAHFLLFVWAALYPALLFDPDGSRMEYYSFGAWPAMALLLGSGLAHAESTASRWLLPIQRAWPRSAPSPRPYSFFRLEILAAARDPRCFSHPRRRAILRSSIGFRWRPCSISPRRLSPACATPSLVAALSLCGALTAAWLLRKRRLSSGMQCSRGSRYGGVLLRR